MTLSRFVESHDYFSPLDRQFARFMTRFAGDNEPLFLAAALVSAAVGRGNVCLDLKAAGEGAVVPGIDGDAPLCPPAADWIAALRGAPVVAEPGERKPLVLDGKGRLYLYRYWKYERDLAAALTAMAAAAPEEVDATRLKEGLNRLFPPLEGEMDRQRLAATTALLRRLTIISGGPGTGKTSTVVKVLALLLEQQTGDVRIALAAPTGKAAARLKEAVASAREGLPVEEGVRQRIPDQVFTLHRLLGIGEGGGRCRFNAENPLPYDVVVVDEASMVDLPLMAKLVAAVPGRCRLILLGDKDQLASVEAGAVLGDICSAEGLSPSGPFRAQLSEATGEPLEISGGGAGGIADSIVVLEKSYRFSSAGGIGELARRINRGEGEGVIDLLGEGREGISLKEADDDAGLRQAILDGYASYLRSGDPEEALRLFNNFRILSPLRRGRYGVEEMNRLAEKLLSCERLIDPSSRWYAGRPVMVTRNDYTLRLFNGDVGIILPDPAAEGALRAWFPASEGGVRRFIPQSLPAHETVYAMTVHKSQGSEFRRVLLLLPESRGEFLTRELLYTAVTRAIEKVEIRGGGETLCAAIGRRVRRASGLSDLLRHEK